MTARLKSSLLNLQKAQVDLMTAVNTYPDPFCADTEYLSSLEADLHKLRVELEGWIGLHPQEDCERCHDTGTIKFCPSEPDKCAGCESEPCPECQS